MACIVIKEELTCSSITCRLCLIQNSTYYEVFRDDHDHPEIADILRNLMGVTISPMDNWPKSVCTACVELVNEFRTLLIKAKQNEARLAEVFGEYQLREENPEDFRQNVKLETSEESIKEEESDVDSECASLGHADIKEEKETVQDESRKRVGRPSGKKVAKRRGRKQKEASPDPPDDDNDDDDDEEDSTGGFDVLPSLPSMTVAEFEELSQRKKEEKRLRDEKIDAEIHSFFKMECELCQIKFPRFGDVQVHFRAVHKCRGYVVCCGKKLNRPMKLHEHMNDHVNPTMHKCTVCLKNYKTQYGLQVHKKLRHTPPELREFRCDQCPQSFVQMSRLKAHMITHMAPKDKKHVCQTCGRAFALASILVQHVRRVHENSCVSVCEVCAKIFRCKNLFKQHVAEHTSQQEPLVPCTVCGKMFKHRIAMRKHMQRHNTTGPLECPICQRMAPNKPALTEHIKYKHKAQRIHKCTLCERSFKTALSLKEHMASHTGQVLYSCLFCPKQFNSNANYFRHNKMSHPLEWEAEKEKKRAERAS
ncbi:transcription factor grauzone-like [Phlebotomus argentipes]|uniref:transcription factor grauzone-like n=1 Tax=Phlebotomus argentipes TaxID=94469 RepID=UPI002892A1C7|nr:transcription factor grauzone-like [Phlebotomus argentipes]